MIDNLRPHVRDHLENVFTYHAPKDGQTERYEAIRKAGLEFAALIADLTPESHEQANAVDHVDQAVMWANASIARNE